MSNETKAGTPNIADYVPSVPPPPKRIRKKSGKNPPPLNPNKKRGSGGYMVGRKPRCDNQLHAAGEDVMLETFNLLRSKPAPWVRQWLIDIHGIRVSTTVIYRFAKRYEHERELDEQGERTARTVAHMVKENLIDGSDADTVKRMESFLMGQALTNNDPSSYVALQKLEIERIKLRLERDKLELNKRKLDQLDQLEGIAKNETYTPEQKGELLSKVLT